MAFEIDYIPVGEGERGGDAIAMRFGNWGQVGGTQTVVVIDAGYQESAEALVAHIRNYYGTNTVDMAISTHPDSDHVSGLAHVLEEMQVNNLLMHRPWDHASNIRDMVKSQNGGLLRTLTISNRFEKTLQCGSDLESLAQKKKIPIYEPFQGMTAYGVMTVLGPSQTFYEELLPQFRGLPPAPGTLAGLFPPMQKAVEAVKWVRDHVGLDLLTEDADTTSAENNSSTVLLFNIDGHKFLFTGDAGKTALTHAADYANGLSIPLTDLRFFDVPHHGSKRNINSKILKRIQGKTAFISAPKDSPKHPSKRVINALQKHGMSVYCNTAGIICHHDDTTPMRAGWNSINPQPFHELVEE